MAVRRARRLKWKTPESFVRHVSSNGFITSHRPTFVQRSHNLLRTDMGSSRFIPDSVQRLLDSGLLHASDIDNSWFSWTRHNNIRRLGFCSTMFRVVGISSILDSNDVDEDLLDFVVYHECLHLRHGYRPDERAHDRQFREWEHEYPDWERCESGLRALGGR